MIDDELQTAPRRLELLEVGMVKDDVHLPGDLLVDLGDERVGKRLVDLLVLMLGRQELAHQRLDPAARDGVPVVTRSQLGLAEDLVEQ